MIVQTRIKGIMQTEVILHCYDRNYVEEINPNLNDGERHKLRAFIIAKGGSPYPDANKLRSILNNPRIVNHHVTNSIEYGEKLGNFCPQCLINVKQECNKKFNWNL